MNLAAATVPTCPHPAHLPHPTHLPHLPYAPQDHRPAAYACERPPANTGRR
jgi:hypothetical protein